MIQVVAFSVLSFAAPDRLKIIPGKELTRRAASPPCKRARRRTKWGDAGRWCVFCTCLVFSYISGKEDKSQ